MENKIPRLDSTPNAVAFGKVTNEKQLEQIKTRLKAHIHAYEILKEKDSINASLVVAFKIQFCHQVLEGTGDIVR